MDLGIVTEVKLVHSLKAFVPKTDTLSGIRIWLIPQPWNALSPMVTKLSGSTIFVKDEQLRKVLYSIVLIFLGIEIAAKERQPLKVLEPMLTNDSGKEIDVKFVQPPKAVFSMLWIPSCKVTLLRLEQLWKAASPIESTLVGISIELSLRQL